MRKIGAYEAKNPHLSGEDAVSYTPSELRENTLKKQLVPANDDTNS